MNNYKYAPFPEIDEKVNISSYIMCLILMLLPFDSFLGETIRIPIVPGLLLAFIVIRFIENLTFDLHKLDFTPIFLFVVYGIFTLIMGGLKVGISYNFKLFIFNVLFLAVATLGFYNKKEMDYFLKTAPFSMLFFILICFSTMKLSNSEIYMGIRDICDPNYLITGMVLVVGMQVFNFFNEKIVTVKVIYALELLLFLFFVVLIGTRSGLLACLMTIFLAFVLGSKHPVKTLSYCFIALLVLGLLALGFLSEDLLERFNIFEILTGTGSGRTIIWKNYLSLYNNSDLFTIIFGFGRDYVPKIYFELFGHSSYYSHNLYIKTLVEGGIIGMSIFTIMVGWCLYTLHKNGNNMVLSAFMGLLIGSIFLDMDNMRVFWMLIIFVLITRNTKIYMRSGKYEIFDYSTDL